MTQQLIGGVFGEGNLVGGGETKDKTERDQLTWPELMAV
jgi:hypothetical protein